MVFKVPKTLLREEVLKFFNDLNKSIGDVEINGLRHPFRLAGFRNMKPKHLREGQRPFVSVIVAVNRFCERCTGIIQARMARLNPLKKEVEVEHHQQGGLKI